jgi:hypothetical protein
MLLNPEQIAVVAEVIDWASKHPMSVDSVTIPIHDPHDFDGGMLGFAVIDEYGYVKWDSEG